MTVQEAKEILGSGNVITANCRSISITNQARDIAIKCMEEVEQYRALGTVEELKEAREKQVAVKHHHTRVDNITDKVRKSICPKCLGIIYTHREEYPNYCANCGQKIDWEEGGTSD